MKETESNFKLILGLGNPGARHKNTYHNIGILAVEFLSAAKTSWTTPSSKPFSFTKHENTAYAKSLLFMNNSGEAAEKALKFFNLSPSDLIVIHDESDLPIGTFRIQTGRGAAGHHGIESVQNALGTKEFTRVRIGIRKTETGKAMEVVLKKISKADILKFYSVFAEVKAKLSEKE